jgi:hypothetical protein
MIWQVVEIELDPATVRAKQFWEEVDEMAVCNAAAQ